VIELIVAYGLGASALYLGYRAYHAVRLHYVKKYDPVMSRLHTEAHEIRLKMISAYRDGEPEEIVRGHASELIKVCVREGFRAFYLEECA
jgi:hypothetical protein